MTPGPPCKLTCPKCGGHKLIGTIASGNTFGGTLWSDSKHDYPMLPQPSIIQHCPKCGHYYFYRDGNPRVTHNEFFSFDFGELTFEQVNEAFDELFNDNLSECLKLNVLFLWLFKYNDKYGGRLQNDSLEECPDSVVKRHAEIVEALLNSQSDNTLLVAELHRELGNFEKCIELASPLAVGEDFTAEVARKFIEHAKMNDTLVFPLMQG